MGCEQSRIDRQRPGRLGRQIGHGRHKLGLAAQGPSDAEQELQDYLTMSPAERLFTQILQSLGITKEQYAAMTPAQKEEVARKVQERIKELAKQEQGAAGPV